MSGNRMVEQLAIVAACTTFAAFGIAYAGPDARDCTVKDKSGTVTEVRGMDIDDVAVHQNIPYAFGMSPWAIGVQTASFRTFVDWTSLIKLSARGSNGYEVTYNCPQGQTCVTGRIDGIRLKGQSELGAYGISLDRVAELSFKRPAAVRTRDVQQGPWSATVFLGSGETVTANDIQIHYRKTIHGVDNGYIPPKPWVSIVDYHYRDLRLQHGDSSVVLPFEKVSSITFTAKQTVLVSLVTGSATELRISEGGTDVLTGCIFDTPVGVRYFPLNLVTKIELHRAAGNSASGPTPPPTVQ